MTSQAALVNIQRVSKDCALSEVTRDGLDTAEVWGSSPHAPTIFIELFSYLCPPFIVHGTVWQTFGRVSQKSSEGIL